MRFAFVAALIGALTGTLLPWQADAFDIEEHRLFAVEAPLGTLKVLSTGDLAIFSPYIEAFQTANPGIAVDYTVASSTEVMRAIQDEAHVFDLVISSAMDLQTKLANDGLAARYQSDVTRSLPDWAKWRDQVIGLTLEPAVVVLSEAAFEGLPLPETRGDLVALLRAHPARFAGRIGTYDIRVSGLGYLFATQDSRSSESFWSLMEVFGRLRLRLYCCSGAMIDDVVSGRLAIAYNVLGSYVERRLTEADGVRIVRPSDFTSLMQRTAIVPTSAASPALAGRMIDFLISVQSQDFGTGIPTLPGLRTDHTGSEAFVRPITLGPELLVFLDKLRQRNFVDNWVRAVEQDTME